MTIETFREEVRAWLSENFTAEIKAAADGSEERKEWVHRLADKGWIVPNWPKEYGGGGLNFQEHIALSQEFGALGRGSGRVERGSCAPRDPVAHRSNTGDGTNRLPHRRRGE